MSSSRFYVTTPIYYGNGIPHVGHFYSSLIANTLYKYHKISGVTSRFTTGIDENSQKAVIEAEKSGLDIMSYLDTMAGEHKKVWDHFEFDYTDFIRTTEPRHKKVVQNVLQHCFDKADIYPGQYEGKYCIGCEAFKKDDELIEQDGVLVCADHLTEPQLIQEKNYFFKLSKYQTWLQEFYEAHPDFVVPAFRFNEVKAFVERGLEDFSISRETATFGIPVPFDDSQVTYVWFDALFNYYTSCIASRAGDKDALSFIDEKSFWENTDQSGQKVHVVGKDIIRFHAIFWPAMLASYFDLGEQRDGVIHYLPSDRSYLPDTIVTTGFFTVDGQKMSKTIGNVIEPVGYSSQYSKDLLALYMLSAFPIGNDGDYDRQQAILTYNAKLANNLGNLVNRVVVLSLKLGHALGEGIEDFRDIAPESYEDEMKKLFGNDADGIIASYAKFSDITEAMQSYYLKDALDICFDMLDDVNKFADTLTPWTLLKTDPKMAEIVLYIIARRLIMIGCELYPFFPEKMTEMFEKLGYHDAKSLLEDGKKQAFQESIDVFDIREKGKNLFDRFEIQTSN